MLIPAPRIQIVRIIGIVVACQRKFLPHQHSFFVAQFIERFFVYNSPAPDPENIKIGFKGPVDQLFVSRCRDDSGKDLGIHPVGSFAENPASVDLHLNGRQPARFRKIRQDQPGLVYSSPAVYGETQIVTPGFE